MSKMSYLLQLGLSSSHLTLLNSGDGKLGDPKHERSMDMLTASVTTTPYFVMLLLLARFDTLGGGGIYCFVLASTALALDLARATATA